MNDAPEPPPPLDEAGAGPGWFVLRMMLHAAAGVFSGRVLLLATSGLLLTELGTLAIFGLDRTSAAPLLTTTGFGHNADAWSLLEAGWQSQLAFWQANLAPFSAWQPEATMLQQGGVGLLRLGIWSLFGVAIARIAAQHLTFNERATATAAMGRSWRGWPGQALGPLGMVILLGGLWWLLWLLGVVCQAFSPALAIASLMAPVLAILAALLSIVLAIGIPLIWAAQAVERPDPFDAVSCGVGYAYQRPLRLLAYVAQALLVGAVAGAVLIVVTQLAFDNLGIWLQGFGGSANLVGRPNSQATLGAWDIILRYVPTVFHAAYFWFATTALYLLLRRDIDEKQADEIYSDEESASAST